LGEFIDHDGRDHFYDIAVAAALGKGCFSRIDCCFAFKGGQDHHVEGGGNVAGQFIEVNGENFAAVEQVADHGEAGLLEATARKEDNALPITASVAIAVGEDSDFGIHPFIKDFVGLKLRFGEVGGAGGCRWHPDSIGAEGSFFDFYGFKGVVSGISRRCG
jgi:hypothetical protein